LQTSSFVVRFVRKPFQRGSKTTRQQPFVHSVRASYFVCSLKHSDTDIAEDPSSSATSERTSTRQIPSGFLETIRCFTPCALNKFPLPRDLYCNGFVLHLASLPFSALQELSFNLPGRHKAPIRMHLSVAKRKFMRAHRQNGCRF
jgi:hypothetical protein